MMASGTPQPQLDRPVVLATRNKGKVAEFRDLFEGLGVEIRTLEDFGPIPPVEEDGLTFEENALKKARFTARVLGLPSIADDSGLTIEALHGRPGVRSARYSGEDATDEANNRKVLEEMAEMEDRRAAFVCVIAIAVPRGPALIYEGTCEGMIAQKQAGSSGFGYDPVFFYPPLGKTFAQLSLEEKNRISHRGKAMAEVRAEAGKVMVWLRQRLQEEPDWG